MAADMYRITRGPWVSELDRRFGGASEQFLPNYEEALRLLEAQDQHTMTDLAAERVGPDAASHFGDDWLGSWWPQAQPIEPILRRGLIEAMKKGLAARLPLSALWIQATDSEFEIGISQSATQITLLFITPPAPSPVPGGPPTEPGDVVLVYRRDGAIVVEPSSTT
jgi:hypothetical protein